MPRPEGTGTISAKPETIERLRAARERTGLSNDEIILLMVERAEAAPPPRRYPVVLDLNAWREQAAPGDAEANATDGGFIRVFEGMLGTGSIVLHPREAHGVACQIILALEGRRG